MDDVYIYYVELPAGINEALLKCVGGYTLYLDPRQSKEGMRRSYEHALKHIQNDDFSKTDIQEIEYKAHKG
jgi:hypothetical protein